MHSPVKLEHFLQDSIQRLNLFIPTELEDSPYIIYIFLSFLYSERETLNSKNIFKNSFYYFLSILDYVQ